MRNKIKLTILEIIVLMQDTTLKVRIQKEICERTGVAQKSVYRWLDNYTQPNTTQLVQILNVLKTYKPSLVLEDLLEEGSTEMTQKVHLTK